MASGNYANSKYKGNEMLAEVSCLRVKIQPFKVRFHTFLIILLCVIGRGIALPDANGCLLYQQVSLPYFPSPS